MVKFHGEIGFGHTVETSPDVWKEQITKRKYFGDVIRNARRLEVAEDKVNFDLSLSNAISIVADKYANENIFAIRFVRWGGAFWVIDSVESQPPRLILRMGGIYNGDTE